MLRNREPPLRIQFMLARQLRQIWRAKELAAAGASRGDIASAVGINPYFLDDVLVPARRMSRAALERALERLYQADLAAQDLARRARAGAVAPGAVARRSALDPTLRATRVRWAAQSVRRGRRGLGVPAAEHGGHVAQLRRLGVAQLLRLRDARADVDQRARRIDALVLAEAQVREVPGRPAVAAAPASAAGRW